MKSKATIFLPAVLLLTFVIFLVMNVYTPKITDDYYWENIPGTGQKVESINDIFLSIYDYYMARGGGITGCRVVAVFVAQASLLAGKNIFNFLNALVYVMLMCLICYHITGGIKKINALLFFAVNVLVWWMLPSWGENFLWLTGSCFYAWPFVIILLFLAPLRRIHDDGAYNLSAPCSALYLFLGILAGLSYENAGAGTFFFLIAYFLLKIINREKIKLFEILGAAGFLVGFAVLIAAPGNYSRLNGYEFVRQYSFVKRLFIRLFETTQIFFLKGGVFLTGLSLVFGIDIFRNGRKMPAFSFLYVLAGAASAYSMILSPVFLDRAFFPVTIFLIIALLNILCQIEMPALITKNVKSLVALTLLLFSFSLAKAGTAVYKSYTGDITLRKSERHYGQSH
ncbi:MAG: DUF6056 family protein [Treponema sp.]|jgi:hypothetical protein|nr:DUF6056 family protein [Treponema sp.]